MYLIIIILNYSVFNITIYRYLECIKKLNGCKAQGEMFKGKNAEWLFVLHDYPHNHPSHEDVQKFDYK